MGISINRISSQNSYSPMLTLSTQFSSILKQKPNDIVVSLTCHGLERSPNIATLELNNREVAASVTVHTYTMDAASATIS
jgi:hypothetical protein